MSFKVYCLPASLLTLLLLSLLSLTDGDVLAIKEHLIDELDYILVPTEGWNKLVSWYGLTEGQEPIARKVGLDTIRLAERDQRHNAGKCDFLLLTVHLGDYRSLHFVTVCYQGCSSSLSPPTV